MTPDIRYSRIESIRSRRAYRLPSTDAYGTIAARTVYTSLGYAYCLPCAARLEIAGDTVDDNLTDFECDACGVRLSTVPLSLVN